MRTEEIHPVLLALLEAPRAWSTIPQLAALLDQEIDHVKQQVIELYPDGFIDISQSDSGPVVTFSQRAIDALNLELVDAGIASVLWTRVPAPDVIRMYTDDEDRVDPIDLVEDRQPGPQMSAMIAEESAARAEKVRARRARRGLPLRYQDVPQPTIVITGRAGIPWDEYVRPRRSLLCKSCLKKKKKRIIKLTCPCGRGLRRRPRFRGCHACEGVKLSRSMLCLVCHRWGWDDYFRPRLRRPRPIQRKEMSA